MSIKFVKKLNFMIIFMGDFLAIFQSRPIIIIILITKKA